MCFSLAHSFYSPLKSLSVVCHHVRMNVNRKRKKERKRADIKFILCSRDRGRFVVVVVAIFTFYHNFVCINTIIFVLLKLLSVFLVRRFLPFISAVVCRQKLLVPKQCAQVISFHCFVWIFWSRIHSLPNFFSPSILAQSLSGWCWCCCCFHSVCTSVVYCVYVCRVYKSLCAYLFCSGWTAQMMMKKMCKT